jgi:hypothetical protein
MADDPRSVAFNPAAPEGERYDARAELEKTYRPTRSDLIPTAEIMGWVDQIQVNLAEQEMRKAEIIQFPGARSREAEKRGMQSVYLDDLQLQVSGEYYEKPDGIGFEGLREMARSTPIINSILMTRIRQVSRFCGVSEDGGEGFEIRHQDRKHKLTPAEAESAQLLARFFTNNGWEFNPRKRKALKRANLTGFMAKSVRDTLTFDACPIETEMKRDKRLGIDGFYAVDGSTVRLCTEDGYDGDDAIYALQVNQGRIVTAYSLDSLIYEVRNPRTDVRLAGYGMGECELLARVVTGFLNAMTYNISGFDNNSIPKGLLHLSGNYGPDDLASFKRYWNATVKGMNNNWSLPVMVSNDQESKASFEKFGVEFNEMMFAKWITLLTSLACGVFSIDPAEINFDSFADSKSSLSGSDTESKLSASKDKGLKPLMSFYESLFTDFIVSSFDDKFCFRWVGLEDVDEKQSWEAKKLVLTVDEVRAEAGYGPHPDPKLGSAPVNPSLIGPWQQAQQPQPQGQDFGGAPGEQPDYGTPEDGADGEDEAPQAQDAGAGQPPPDPGSDQEYGGQAAGDFGKALGLGAVIYEIG